jgi:U3 small nucleolar RNA-associated protein 21
LQLWNISTCKMIYEFKGWGSAVRCCVSSPALDTVGIGCSDGKIHVHNLRYDETVVSFSHTTGGPITSLSFRTGMFSHVSVLSWCWHWLILDWLD